MRRITTSLTVLAAVFVVGCRAKVEVEDRAATHLQTADTTFNESKSSRVTVEFAAGSQKRRPEGSNQSPPIVRPVVTPRQPQTPVDFVDDRLIGKWRIVEGEVEGTVEFTPGGNIMFVWYHTGLRRDWIETGSYRWIDPSKIAITEAGDYGSDSTRTIEFLPDGALLVIKGSGHGFTWLFGRLERVE